MTVQDFEDLNQELYFHEKNQVERQIKCLCPDINEIEDIEDEEALLDKVEE